MRETTLEVAFNGEDFTEGKSKFFLYNILSAQPRSGPSDGNGGYISITGQGFRNSSQISCLLDKQVYAPMLIEYDEVRCQMIRAAEGPKFFGNVEMGISQNGKDWHKFTGGF